jgi:hypothetical protein
MKPRSPVIVSQTLIQGSIQWFNTSIQPCAECPLYRHENVTTPCILTLLLPVIQTRLVLSTWSDPDPIARNDLDGHLTINDAVISLRNTVVLGLNRVSMGMGHGLLSVAEEVMVAGSLEIIIVLSRVGSLILEHLKNLVAAESQERTHKGPDIVDPVVTVEARDDRRTEGSGRVDGRARPVGRTDVGDEDRNTNADGGKMSATVLLDSEEVDCQDELGSEEHLDKDTLSDARPVAKSIGDKKRAGEECICNASSGYGSDKLCRDNKKRMDRCHSTDEN